MRSRNSSRIWCTNADQRPGVIALPRHHKDPFDRLSIAQAYEGVDLARRQLIAKRVGVAQSRRFYMDVGAINILIIDDNPLDAELELEELRRTGLSVTVRVVTDELELRGALEAFVPDVILCDMTLPNLDGFTAQRIVREVCPNTPLIFVTGTISEERAVTALQSGAVDYVLKSSLLRLPNSVLRAVHESREKNRFENSLRDTENRSRRHAERLEALWRIANNPTLHGPELIFAMLRQAAIVIRETQPFNGVLGRIDGDEIVVVAVGPASGAADPRNTRLRVGQRTPLEQTIISRAARTQVWDDTSMLVDGPAGITAVGWRSAIVTQFEVDGLRHSLMFWSPEPTTTPFGNEDIAFVEVLAASFAGELQLDALQASLRDEEERSRQHAERLETLWQLVNDPGLRDEELWLAMLREAAAAIRPGQGFQGTLWRVDGTNMVMEAVTESSERVPGAINVRAGAVMPLESTVVGKVLARGVASRSWDDLKGTPYVSTQRSRAFVFTTFNAGGTTWGVSFGSTQPSIKPFTPQDNAYIEVLASFFANHVQQRWQFERIQHQQTYDVLTGLINRSQFRSRARAASNRSERFAILLVDINSFREINESYGHMIGDALLVEVANALAKCAVDDEIVGRVAGDVFGIFIADPPSKEFVRVRAMEFADLFSHGFSTGDRDGKEFIALTASIGAAVAPDDGPKIDAILSHADAALVAAKQPGRDSLVFFEPGMEAAAVRRATLRNELTEAIAGNQFTLYYQPHLEIGTGAVTGCEALIRWNHPTRGLVLPGEFIPFAEETGIITAIDTWVMRNAFAAANELGAMRDGFRLYFNLSGRQAGDPKMIHEFAEAAREGVSLQNIGVEITESDAMRDVEATRRVCRALRRLDVRIAIDDFGTGYSSLSSLKRLPVDIVKIDRSFVSGILNDPHDQTIAETIISIAEHFGFESLAEGAEAPAEIEWLKQHSCRYVQGYAVCHPLPFDEFKSWLVRRER